SCPGADTRLGACGSRLPWIDQDIDVPVPGPEATMTDLLVKPSGDRGCVLQVTPQSAGWTYVGFELHRLEPGDTAGGESGDRELCLVLVSGRAGVTAG